MRGIPYLKHDIKILNLGVHGWPCCTIFCTVDGEEFKFVSLMPAQGSYDNFWLDDLESHFYDDAKQLEKWDALLKRKLYAEITPEQKMALEQSEEDLEEELETQTYSMLRDVIEEVEEQYPILYLMALTLEIPDYNQYEVEVCVHGHWKTFYLLEDRENPNIFEIIAEEDDRYEYFCPHEPGDRIFDETYNEVLAAFNEQIKQHQKTKADKKIRWF